MSIDKIAALLALVPEPHVAAAAGILTGILTVLHKGHLTARATGEVPITEAEIKALVAQGAAEALAPWRRIAERAQDELHPAAPGSTGE